MGVAKQKNETRTDSDGTGADESDSFPASSLDQQLDKPRLPISRILGRHESESL